MKFDESKVINALYPDRVEIGRRYFFADDIKTLKEMVEDNDLGYVFKLNGLDGRYFCTGVGTQSFLLYPAPNPFDESKIIDTLHPEKAVVGKEYYFADGARELKELIRSGNAPVGKYTGLSDFGESFYVGEWPYYLLYPVE